MTLEIPTAALHHLFAAFLTDLQHHEYTAIQLIPSKYPVDQCDPMDIMYFKYIK